MCPLGFSVCMQNFEPVCKDISKIKICTLNCIVTSNYKVWFKVLIEKKKKLNFNKSKKINSCNTTFFFNCRSQWHQKTDFKKKHESSNLIFFFFLQDINCMWYIKFHVWHDLTLIMRQSGDETKSKFIYVSYTFYAHSLKVILCNIFHNFVVWNNLCTPQSKRCH